MYRNSNVVVTGGSATYVAGDIVQSRTSTGFNRLCEHVAAGAQHNSGELSAQPKCHPGTRVAILDHITAWAAMLQYTYTILWLHGPAGAGKSTILRTIAQTLFESGLLIGSFFFFRTADRRNSSEHFIATIAFQLSLSVPATRPHIETAMERNPLIFSLSMWDQAQALIVSPLLQVASDPSFDSSHSPRIIVIDGLDECSDHDKQCEILQVLSRILQSLPIPLAVLIASRPEYHIRGEFDLGVLNKSSSRLSLDNSYRSHADIKKYLRERFQAIPENHPLKTYLRKVDPWPSEDIIQSLVNKASGQFIYASTIDKFVSSTRRNPEKQLNIILGAVDAGTLKPFEQLDALYSAIFHNIDPTDLALALRILGIVIIASNATSASGTATLACQSPEFLEALLDLEIGDVRRLLLDLGSLLHLCRYGFEKHYYYYIEIFHASLGDYLFDKSRSGEFWIDAGMVYADLLQHYILRLPELVHSSSFRHLIEDTDTFFSTATITLELRQAIENCDWGKAPELCPSFFQHIQSLQVHPRDLFHNKLSECEQAIIADLETPFRNIAVRRFVIAVSMSWEDLQQAPHESPCIFAKLRKWVSWGEENQFVHNFINSLSRHQCCRLIPRIRQHLSDPGGVLFVDKGLYADVALHFMKFMDYFWIEAYAQGDHGLRLMSTILPPLLDKAPLRDDLINCAKKIMSNPKSPFPKRSNSIRVAIQDYLSRYEGAAVPMKIYEGEVPSGTVAMPVVSTERASPELEDPHKALKSVLPTDPARQKEMDLPSCGPETYLPDLQKSEIGSTTLTTNTIACHDLNCQESRTWFDFHVFRVFLWAIYAFSGIFIGLIYAPGS